MTSTKLNNIIYFIADGISNHSFIHLHSIYKKIINKHNVILLTLNENLNKDDENLIKNSKIPLSIAKISEIDLNYAKNSFIFPNTYSLPKGNHDFIKSKTGCFIGGVNSKDTIQKQINSATLLDIDFLFSDLLPTEVSNFINSEELTFFCKRINFIQPYFNKSNQLNDHTNEKFLFLFQTNGKEAQGGNKSIIYKALGKTEHCRVVNLDSLEVSNWFRGAIPSKTCRKVITDAIDPIFYNYLFDLCSKERIELINLWGVGTTSPERFFIYESDATANWFDSAENTTSLRSLILGILHEKVADKDSKDIPPLNNSSYCSDLKVISNFVLDRNASKDFSKEMSGNIKTNFHDAFSNDLFITAINHNSNTIKDYSWKLTHDAINHLIHTKDIEDIPDQIINTLFCASLRRIYDKEIKQVGYLFLFNIFNTSNKHFLQSISQVLRSKQLKTSPASVFASVQYLLQSYGSDKNSRKEAFLQLVAIIDSIVNRSSGVEKEALNRVLARLLLSLDDLPRYEQLTAKCIESKYKGVVGDSVYYKIMEDLAPSDQKLEYFEKICTREEDSDLDKITTQLSSCIIKILKGDMDGVIKKISEPRNPAADFTNVTWFMLQLSLICISSKQESIAQFIISKISLPKIKHSNFNLIGFTALKILLNDHSKLDEEHLANNINYDYVPSILESERIMLPYFLFFFLEIIFLATSNKQGVEFTNYHRLMVPYSNKPYFDKILENVPAAGSNNAFLQSFSKHLYDNLPAKESSIINLSTLP
jgi:hypothetical protein